MHETNKKVKELRVKNTENKILLRELKDNLKNVERNELSRITDEKDDSGKVKFSNETKREVELNRRLSIDDDYKKGVENIKQLDKEIELTQIEIDYLTWEMTLSGHRNDDIVDAIRQVVEVLKK